MDSDEGLAGHTAGTASQACQCIPAQRPRIAQDDARRSRLKQIPCREGKVRDLLQPKVSSRVSGGNDERRPLTHL